MTEIKKPETAQELLDVIDTFIAEKLTYARSGDVDDWAEARTSVQHVGAILSTLRGPDNQDSRLKHGTTARIRALVLPKATAANLGDEMWETNNDGWPITVENADQAVQPHFADHIRSAVRALSHLEMAGPDGSKKR